jgi:filamentous hemagglutinin family protein
MIAKSWLGRCWQWQIGGCVAIVGTLSVGVSDRVLAQIVPDNTLGAEGSAVTLDVINGIPSDRIDGGATRGANLFHSFSDFHVREGRGAYFVNSAGIENILTRVTGGNPSNIFGRLGVLGGANLLLLNPNGLVFGANSSLDIQGSFLASTANSFTFPDGSEFSATNPQAPPLLAISVPLGLQYGSNPGSVQVQGSNLQVNPGKTLALVGGGVSMDGGQLTAQGGRIELGGVTGTGTVELSADRTGNLLSLSFPNGLARADVSFINQAKVDVTAPGGGSIAINAGNVNIFGRSRLTAGISQNAGSVGIVADDITVDATGTVTLRESSVIQNIVNTGGTGNAGNVNLAAGSLYLISGSQLFTSSFGQGNAGRVNVNVSDTVSIDSVGKNASTSGIISSIAETGIGNGGNINITSGSLLVTNGAQLNAITRGRGNAGNVTINARDTISLDGERQKSSTRAASAIFTSVDSNEYSGYPNLGPAIGNGGDINITTGSLSITNGAALSAVTEGQGKGGNVTINVRDTVSLDGENSKEGSSGIFSSVADNLYTGQPPAVGDGGDINITSGSLSITRGAGVFANTRGRGNAGRVIINARDTVLIDGEKSNGAASGVFSSVGDEKELLPTRGNGGDINITTGSLSITRGAGVFANTAATGNAGDVTINVHDTVSIDGENSNGGFSGVYTSVTKNGIGDGGDIDITTESFSAIRGGGVFANASGQGDAGNLNVTASQAVTLSGNSQLLVETTGDGAAGDLMIETGRLTVTDGASVSSSTSSSNPDGVGGKLIVNATQSLDLNNGARLLAQSNDTAAAAGSIQISTGNLTAKNGTIATSATKSAGGAITINARDIRLFGDSDIISNVASGADNGGNINLTADSILAFDDSDILAFARDGRGGDITLNTRVFFGENYRPAPKGTDPNTLENNNQVDVNASGAVNGVITTPDVSFIQNSLTELPENQIDTDSLLANSCIVRRNQPTQGSFTITGTGGFAQRPGDAQMSTFPTVDIETLPNDSTPTNTNPNRPWQKGDPIVEPQGVYRLPNGKLVMSRECSRIQ